MNTAIDLDTHHEEPVLPAAPGPSRTFRFRGQDYVLTPIGPEDPARIAEAEGAADVGRAFAPERWGLGVAVAQTARPDDLLGFYALGRSTEPTCFDDTLIFIAPRARGRRLSHLLLYGGYLELLRTCLSFRLREIIDHPRLRLHTRCGYAPPVRQLVDGKVELGNFDLHAVLSRIESENELVELTADLLTF